MNAKELSNRARKRFIEEGYKITMMSKDGSRFSVNQQDWRKGYTVGLRAVWVAPTYRHNGAPEDVTVTMRVFETTNVYGAGKIIAKIKIPKNASENVLNNRVQKAIELIK